MNNSFVDFYGATKWLYTKIYENPVFFFDYWSFVHLIAGFLIILTLLAFNIKHRWAMLFALLTLWEIVELLFKFFALNIFKPETFKDQITDIVIGLISGLITYLIIKNKDKIYSKIHISQEFVASVMSTSVLAFLWMGTYQYHYSANIFNTQGLNIWAFLLCFLGANLIIKSFIYCKNYFKKTSSSFVMLLGLYYISLFIIEYVGRYLVEINEISSSSNAPLAFGLIYGNMTLHIIYIIAPVIVILFYSILIWLFRRILL